MLIVVRREKTIRKVPCLELSIKELSRAREDGAAATPGAGRPQRCPGIRGTSALLAAAPGCNPCEATPVGKKKGAFGVVLLLQQSRNTLTAPGMATPVPILELPWFCRQARGASSGATGLTLRSEALWFRLLNVPGHESMTQMNTVALLEGKESVVYCIQDVLVMYLYQLQQHSLK